VQQVSTLAYARGVALGVGEATPLQVARAYAVVRPCAVGIQES